jgi:hypothetical protein
MMMEQADIHVEVRGQEVIVRLPDLGFEAVYFKPRREKSTAQQLPPFFRAEGWASLSSEYTGETT